MPGSRIQFVDAISDTANVRLDLNSSPWSVLTSGTDTPPPPMRRVVTSNFLEDGSTISSTVYDNRTIALALRLEARTAVGPNQGLLATNHQALNRELNRESNILRWQPDMSVPAQYFRTFRAPDYLENIDYGTGVHSFSVSIVAEPFGYGTLVSLGTITVNNDPNAGTNPGYFDLSASQVIGDVDTPLYMTTTSGINGNTVLIATRRRGAPSSGVYVIQAESMSQGTDTATASGGTSFSPTSGTNESSTSFSTNSSYADRLTATMPTATPGADIRGLYRVFARQKKSVTGSTMHGTLRIAGTIDNPEVTIPDSTTLQLNDYGLLQVPLGVEAQSDGYGTSLGATGVSCTLRFNRTSGSGSLQTDYVLLAPADTELAIIDWPSSPSSVTYVFDGPNDEAYWRNSASANAVSSSGNSPVYRGGLPKVSPNQANRVFFNIMNGAVSASTVLVVGYWPRYLLMRPVTT